MTFTSLVWLAVMVGVTGTYWLLPNLFRRGFMALVCLIFLAAVDLPSATFLVVFTAVSYSMARDGVISKLELLTAVVSVIGIVAYFKAQVANTPEDVFRDIAMPLGMSYYAFRVLHYVIEKYRGLLPVHNFYDYVCYLFFIPTIVVGPIHRFAEFHRDHHNVRWNAQDLSEGIERILIGYFKLVVIGNFLFQKFLATEVAQLGDASSGLALYLDAVVGSFGLYILFSGYSDIAIGFSLMLGYRVMENFNNPFMKTNIAEFWRSWHISLTQWSRDYIYMPVVGATRNPYIGTLCSLLAIGIWHELSPRYIAWGLYHGIGIISVNKLQQYVRKRKRAKGIKISRKPDHFAVKALKIFATANYFFFGYIIISQDSFSDTLTVYQTILFGWL